MDPIISLSLSEWTVVNEFEKLFPKKEGFSIAIPSSRQQKGFDIIVYNLFSKKSLTFQIKGSRSYIREQPKRDTTKRYGHYTWFNAFEIKKGYSDYYILFGLFVKTPKNKTVRLDKKKWYDFILLVFTEIELESFLDNLELKTKDSKDTKYGFGFDEKEKIFLTRGLKEEKDFSEYLIMHHVEKLKNKLNPKKRKFESKKKKTNNSNL